MSNHDVQLQAKPLLGQLLARVRRRLWVLDGLRGACWGVLGAVVTLLVAMWLDLVWELPATIRAATWGCGSVVLVVSLGLLLRRTWKAADTSRMARRIDAASGCQGELLNGFEFAANSNAPQGSVSNNPVTAGLAEMAVVRAGQLAAQVQPAKVISPRPMFIAARSLAAAVAVIALLVVVCPTLARTQWQRFTHPWADTPPYSIYQITVEPGDTEVVYGKGLEVRVAVAGPPVRDVELYVLTGRQVEKVPMFPEANGTWRTQLAHLTNDSTYYARVDRARSASYHIRVITTPAIEDVQFVVSPPAYAHESPATGPLPKAGLVGLAGTRIQVTARSNRPLSSGEIRLKVDGNEETVGLRPVQAGDPIVVGEFSLKRSGKFELRVTDADGQVAQDPFTGSMTLLIDQRPLIRILEPKPQSLATPSTLLPVILDAEDDYGLSQVELYRSLNDSRPIPISLPVSDPPPRRFRDHQYLPLASYDLQPGDEIKLFARVADTDPSAAKGAESTIVTIRIISQADFDQMLRVREGLEVLISKYQQAERRLESLAEEIAKIQKELEQAPPDSPLADELEERLEKLTQEMQEEAEAIVKAAEHELPYDIDQKLKQKLKDLADEVKEEADELQRLVQRSKDKSDVNNEAVMRQLAKMVKKLAEEKEQFEHEATDPLELLAKVYPLMEDQARFTALVLWQTDLAERLASFKDIERSDDPAAKARLRDLQDEQRRAREELTKLLDDIEDHVRELPDDEQFDKLRETATKFAAEVRASGAAEEMTNAETALTDFQGGEGYRHALEAAEILKQFLSKCEGMGGEGGICLSFNPTLNESLGNSIEQLLQDAGLGGMPGKGKGSGGRGGYSARSNNRNVGLYGGSSTRGDKSNSGRGFGKSGNAASGRNQSADSASDRASSTTPWQRSASSASTVPVPPQYRRRVSQYFQRVADELEAAAK